MEIICKERGQGKTYDLICESARTGTPILTAYNPRYISELARKIGVKIPQPMNVHEYKNFRENGSLSGDKGWNEKLLIDEVDGVLEHLLGANVEKATYTPDCINEKENENMPTKKICANSDFVFHRDSDVTVNLPNGIKKIITRNGSKPEIYFPKVENVSIIVPGKVVEVTFDDGTKEKSVCREPDVFSLESAISICISKKIMGGSSAYNNAVKHGVKIYEDRLEKEKAGKEEQERIEKKRAKRLAYKERRNARKAAEENQQKAREREERIEIQKEAYLRAIKELQNVKPIQLTIS